MAILGTAVKRHRLIAVGYGKWTTTSGGRPRRASGVTVADARTGAAVTRSSGRSRRQQRRARRGRDGSSRRAGGSRLSTLEPGREIHALGEGALEAGDGHRRGPARLVDVEVGVDEVEAVGPHGARRHSTLEVVAAAATEDVWIDRVAGQEKLLRPEAPMLDKPPVATAHRAHDEEDVETLAPFDGVSAESNRREEFAEQLDRHPAQWDAGEQATVMVFAVAPAVRAADVDAVDRKARAFGEGVYRVFALPACRCDLLPVVPCAVIPCQHPFAPRGFELPRVVADSRAATHDDRHERDAPRTARQ